jgi:hypothetical protein
MQQMDQIKKKTDYYKMEKIFFSKIENNVA